MTYASVPELLAATRPTVQLDNGDVTISDPRRFREELLDPLTQAAVAACYDRDRSFELHRLLLY